jgi:hypothetical protein
MPSFPKINLGSPRDPTSPPTVMKLILTKLGDLGPEKPSFVEINFTHGMDRTTAGQAQVDLEQRANFDLENGQFPKINVEKGGPTGLVKKFTRAYD